jgi:uncharacterized protein YkwD
MPTTVAAPSRLVRAAAAAVLAGLVLTVLPASPSPAAAAVRPASGQAAWQVRAERDMLAEINRVRAVRGLRAFVPDGRVWRVAGLRSTSMARQGYFAHVSPNGTDAGDLLRASRVRHSSWGEVIGWTVYMPIGDGVDWMVDWWLHSPSHRPILLSSSLNYAGVGIVMDGPTTLYTVVFSVSPDHTPPLASLVTGTALLTGPRSADRATTTSRAARREVRVSWWGKDRPLVTRTSGLASFDVQHKRPGGTWRTVLNNTARRGYTFKLGPGTHVFRVRAQDRRGNTSRWQPARYVRVH